MVYCILHLLVAGVFVKKGRISHNEKISSYLFMLFSTNEAKFSG